MNIVDFSLQEQMVLLIAALVLFTSFALLAQQRMLASIHVFAWQGALVAGATALIAAVYDQPHLYFSAALTMALKALFMPWMLHRLVNRLGIQHHVETVVRPSLILLAAAALVVFSYYVALPIEKLSLLSTRNTIAISMAVVLLGMLMMVSRRQAVSQVIGFMSIENGLFFAAVVSTHGMPMVVELGIAFDVLVAAVLFGVFFLQIRDSIESLDVDRLNRLSETRLVESVREAEE
ncbi:MAG: formate hydrogenlyase [Thiogranum sp.]|nr:formate hydrogenlyase [Thiogranum sp.]